MTINQKATQERLLTAAGLDPQGAADLVGTFRIRPSEVCTYRTGQREGESGIPSVDTRNPDGEIFERIARLAFAADGAVLTYIDDCGVRGALYVGDDTERLRGGLFESALAEGADIDGTTMIHEEKAYEMVDPDGWVGVFCPTPRVRGKRTGDSGLRLVKVVTD